MPLAAERGLNGALVRALLGGVSPHESCLSARSVGGRYEGGSAKGAWEVRMVLEETEGVRVRGGMIEAEAETEEGGDGEAEEMVIGGTGTGTDMVVMSDAITSFLFLSFPHLFLFFSFCSVLFSVVVIPPSAECIDRGRAKGLE